VSATYKCRKCGTLLAPHDIPYPHCDSNLRDITVVVNEILGIEAAGRIIKDWFMELTEWIHTPKILITSAGILMNYYEELFVLFFSRVDWLAFLINHEFIKDKVFVNFFTRAMIQLYEGLFTKYAPHIVANNKNTFPSFKYLYQRYKEQPQQQQQPPD
jgi:hypothetical protein